MDPNPRLGHRFVVFRLAQFAKIDDWFRFQNPNCGISAVFRVFPSLFQRPLPIEARHSQGLEYTMQIGEEKAWPCKNSRSASVAEADHHETNADSPRKTMSYCQSLFWH